MNASSAQKTGKPGRASVFVLAWMLLLASVFAAADVAAQSIDNTAVVSYTLGDATEPEQATSNTVSTPLLPMPTRAQLEFLAYDPPASGLPSLPVDGTRCQAPSGTFGPSIPLVDASGTALDLRTTPADPVSTYRVGVPVIVLVRDANRNIDSATREYVDVSLATTTGDAETLRLLETGPDTGVFAGIIQGMPMPPDPVRYDCALSLADAAKITATYVDDDFPLDHITAVATAVDATPADIRLEQTASKAVVEVGDFIEYTLTAYNIGAGALVDVEIRDVLPPGMRYRADSARIGQPYQATPAATTGDAGGSGPGTMGAAVRQADAGSPAGIGTIELEDGRTLLFNVGNLKPGEAVTVTFIAEVGPGSAGQRLVNYAIATANGALSSNETDTMVRMVESLNTWRFTIVGWVRQAADCTVPPGERQGVPGVRVMLQDGTYTTTDANGAYHFEGVRPGTHVVQLDVLTLPGDLEASSCRQNTRFAGREDSQFVEGQGGSLHRADFLLRPKAPATGSVGASMAIAADGDLHRYSVQFDGGPVPVSKLRAMVALPEGATIVQGSSRVDAASVADPSVNGGIAIFDLGDPGVDWRRTLEFDVRVGHCPEGGLASKAVALFNAGGKDARLPPAEAVVHCNPPPEPARSGRVETEVASSAGAKPASAFFEQENRRAGIVDDATAAGAKTDWLKGQSPGHGLLFPAEDYNPRLPVTRIVVKTAPGERVDLRLNGQPVDPIHFDGSRTSSDGGIEVAMWKNVPIAPGDNRIDAKVTGRDGNVVATLSRVVHYANAFARAELVEEASILVADGLRAPVLAVRMLDPAGKPLAAGMNGDFSIAAPYQRRIDVDEQQRQQLGGREETSTRWVVEGDEGIAYIELQPTSAAGRVVLTFDTGEGYQGSKPEVTAWLKSAPRDWIIVGFASGSVGYETLRDNMDALEPGEDGKGVRAEGQAAFYAKGRVLGKWLMTLAYDSDKDTGRLRNQNLLSTIDPGQYYTLYGDGTQQAYDAASASKLYLKLERDQFYVMFGDIQSGLDRNELSRYQRTLNGARIEYHGPLVEFNGFAARTSQNYIRDEIQGDGTSGLYRLRQRRIVFNSERIRLETRDRYHSEQILQSRELVRHIDYDIDYENGTLFFREPIASRDFDFNPNWIVVEYETRGTGEEFLNGGGRVGIHAMEGRLETGVTYLRDEDAAGRSQLAGVDARFRLTKDDELRAEIAGSRGQADGGDTSGSAWLFEWEHRGEQLNLLAYARRQSPGFGLGQQNRYESGMSKLGVEGQYRIAANFTLQGEVYRQEDLASGAVRDAARLEAQYRADDWSVQAGFQSARDESGDGRVAESRQATLGVTKSLLDRRLELGARAAFSLGGENESVDFPTRLELSAAYKVNEAVRILAAQEFTDGKDRDTSTTRVGLEARPWTNATLTTTLNQAQVSEYGPRTFALFGLKQKFAVNERWSFDVALDSSRAFNESSEAPLVVDPSQPIQAGGIRDGGALTEDFVALSGGATRQTELWMWNARVEGRQSDDNDRYGFTTAFLRQIRDGIALSASAQAFSQRNADGSTGILANAQLSWAWRPLGGNWSILDKLEFRLDELRSGTGSSIIGNATIAASGDARSARIVNNFVLNYASAAWDQDDGSGSVLDLYQRSQLSLYYGSKYVIDSYGAGDYAGYTDILGAEYRFDLTSRIDIGIRASVLHSWSQDTYAWAFGPSVGFTPFTNAWVSVGYNVRGFSDRDFESSHYTAQGAYLVFRMKFDQRTFGLDRARGAAH